MRYYLAKIMFESSRKAENFGEYCEYKVIYFMFPENGKTRWYLADTCVLCTV